MAQRGARLHDTRTRLLEIEVLRQRPFYQAGKQGIVERPPPDYQVDLGRLANLGIDSGSTDEGGRCRYCGWDIGRPNRATSEEGGRCQWNKTWTCSLHCRSAGVA
jgi:hypothetical protein